MALAARTWYSSLVGQLRLRLTFAPFERTRAVESAHLRGLSEICIGGLSPTDNGINRSSNFGVGGASRMQGLHVFKREI